MTSHARTGRLGSVPAVAIVGGGFTGAAIALHLTRQSAARVLVYEPREALGRGLAYSDCDPAFRINVPATRMSLFPADRLHFSRWIEATGAVDDDPDALASDGRLYPRRSVFGDYVAAHLEPCLASGAAHHVRRAVARIECAASGWRVVDERGGVEDVEAVVLAATHPPAALPAQLAPFAGHSRLCADVLKLGALLDVRANERLLIVGSGLTAADAVAVLDRKGHDGPVLLIARRGQRPQPQAPDDCEPFGDFVNPPATTARAVVRRVRVAVAAASDRNIVWQAVLDAVRAQGGAIWAQLPVAERRRLVRHVRPYWDAHRFRTAPQVFELLARQAAAGALSFLKASLVQVEGRDTGFEVTLALRSRSETVRRRFDRIIVATGPSHRDILLQPWAADLAMHGRLAMDTARLGLDVTRQCQVRNASGEIVEGLFVGGPLARGAFGELMGLPEVSEHAMLAAGCVARYLDAREARGAG